MTTFSPWADALVLEALGAEDVEAWLASGAGWPLGFLDMTCEGFADIMV